MSALYSEDFSSWSLTQAAGLRYVVLLPHLLKWQFQPGHRCGGWQSSIPNQRRTIARLLRKNLGLKAKIADELADAYAPARLRATSETGFAPATFPERCPFARRPLEDGTFWPGGEPDS